MRKIEITAAFRRDFKRERRSGKVTDIESLVDNLASALGRDEALPKRAAITGSPATGVTTGIAI